MTTKKPNNFIFSFDGLRGSSPPFDTEWVYGQVWRFDFDAPGCCLLDCGPGIDSHTLRSRVITLKETLSEVNIRRTGEPFVFRSLSRFDQQVTTKFHRDGAPDRSMLMLGYEPSKVRSRLFLADFTRASFDLGMTPTQFLDVCNPMYRRGEELLVPYVTELPKPEDGHSWIVLINNSSLPFSGDRTNPLGVLHKAEIVNPTADERRIVNSTMLAVGDGEGISEEQVREFISTDRISKKDY